MKTTILSILSVLVLFSSPVRAEGPLLFVSDMDFAPYSMVADGGRATGIDVEVLAEAARRAGLELTVQPQEWATLIEMVRQGRCDGATSLFRTPEREQFAMFMDAVPVHFSDYVLFTLAGGRFPFESYDDLAGKTLGQIVGVNLGPEFEAARSAGKMKVVEFQDHREAMKGLLNGTIDAFAGNIDVTYNRLTTMGMTSSIVYLPRKIVSGQPSYAVLSRSSSLEDKDMVIQKIEQALDQMHRDGTYNTIAKRYLFRF
ncbi:MULTISPECIES: transporter substrate-binding domain-containing protein [unclassified Pseudodesulfovibrio]|uniref:substrate-binding periplasmic protein n=1 Tax=unclassified Pseudodesulfovibrio TaxID=2661612 RepID=UPI000FEB9A50|nr:MULTISPECIES: transporter substrate-binding domain-containing protein [unclassified Pseudodesulfovibrio]MCJ2165977.1 transporter substrate-binding domain-containing protein [Pseudodesulfovibrio sp. S3-i]RWU02585.1 ABC transporter substrate-binding protein [Pseudodesulfovibrio sp. S3]